MEYSKSKKIQHIQIVTNGTLLFSSNMIKILKNKRVSVDISNYADMSKKYYELIDQLKNNKIKFYTQEKRIFWTKSSNFIYRNRDKAELENVYSKCRMDCITMLNGKIHICARSSHGMDLNIIPDNDNEYIDVRREFNRRSHQIKLFKLLNSSYISACNYCDLFRWKELPTVVSGEQISKKEAKILFEERCQ